MRNKKREKETMLNVYELTIFMLLCSNKEKEESTSEHWYWHHYQRINISKERTKYEKKKATLIPR
jgi:hypothetical protein